MSSRRVPNAWEWRRLHERLDGAIAETARAYMLRLAVEHISISVGKLSEELDELRLGREPDYNLTSHVNLTGIEPSREMVAFSECSRYRDRVSSNYKQSSIADLPTMEAFDLAVFSASLPYAFDEWEPIMTAIVSG
jgi:hypothetical protein